MSCSHQDTLAIYDLTSSPLQSSLEQSYKLASIDSLVQRMDVQKKVRLCCVVTTTDDSKKYKRRELLPTAYIRQRFPQKLIEFYESKTKIID